MRYFVLFGARTRQDKAVPTVRGEGWQSKIFVGNFNCKIFNECYTYMYIIKVTDDQFHNNSYPKKNCFMVKKSQQKVDYNWTHS